MKIFIRIDVPKKRYSPNYSVIFVLRNNEVDMVIRKITL